MWGGYLIDDTGEWAYLPSVVYNDSATEPGNVIKHDFSTEYLGLVARDMPHVVKYHHPYCDCAACCVVRHYWPDLWYDERG